MSRFPSTYLWIGLALLLMTLPAEAKRPFFEEAREPRRWVLLRPKMDNPVAQLAYADLLREEGKLRRSQRQYRALVRYWPNTLEASAAQHALAQVLYARGKEYRATQEYERLFDFHAGAFAHDEVLAELFSIAQATEVRRRGTFLFLPGWRAPERAIPVYELVVRHGPRWENAPQALFQMGQLHEEQKDWEDAILMYDRLMIRYPRHALTAEAAHGKARALTAWALEYPRHVDGLESAVQANMVALRDTTQLDYQETARDAIVELRQLVAALDWDVARYYDRIAKAPQAAIISYEGYLRRHPASQQAAKAEQRIAYLKARQSGEP
jgi:outer membrane protein assembly factor BamD (BamD/ComL family)